MSASLTAVAELFRPVMVPLMGAIFGGAVVMLIVRMFDRVTRRD